MEAPLHADLEPLAFLLGTWTGEGVGDYPTIARFRYSEEMTFTHIGKPFFSYSQRTWSPDGGAALHSESGFWRAAGPGAIEVVLAHPFGVVEIQEGGLEGRRISLMSKTLASASTADQVAAVTRSFEVDGDVLRYTVDMAAADQPLQRHLEAELRRA
ncbi:MAG: FABP family protein [Actinomycetota bacterium]